MRPSIDKWRKTFWISVALVWVSLLASELGAGASSVYMGVVSGAVASVSLARLFVAPGSRQPRVH